MMKMKHRSTVIVAATVLFLALIFAFLPSIPVSAATAPTITQQPDSTTKEVGDTATFAVKAQGEAPLTYRWQSRQNSSAAWSNSGQNGAKTATLNVSASAGLNGWQFRCIVTEKNGNSTATKAATLTVIPKITAQPANVSCEAGTTAKFVVAASGKTPLIYQWQSRKDANSTWSNSGQSGAKTAALNVSVTAGLNGWQFRCVVTSANGQKNTSKAATLKVIPKITAQPESVRRPSGTNAIFTVAATGKAPLSYQWQSRKDANSAWSNSGQSGAKTTRLAVATKAGLNGWQFRCVITDSNGNKTYSQPATLSVYVAPPTILTQPKDQTVTPESYVEFSIDLVGVVPFEVQWQSRKDANSSWTNSGLYGAKSCAISLIATPGLNGWQFRCVVTSNDGLKVYSDPATLRVISEITKQPEDVIAAPGATAYYFVDAVGKGPLTYQWQSRKDANSAWSNSGQPGAKTKTLAVAAKAGLNGWQFRCMVTDGNGQKIYSNPAKLNYVSSLPKAKKVLIINFDPVFNINGKQVKMHDLMDWWNDPYELATQFAATMADVSYGNASYTIAETIELNEFPQNLDGPVYNTKTYYDTLNAATAEVGWPYWEYTGWIETGFSFNYDMYLTKYDVYGKVNRGEIDEVWIFTGPMTGVTLNESMMVGKDAFFINGDEIVKPGLRNFAVYGFNYERALDCMLEDAGHRFEFTMDRVYFGPGYHRISEANYANKKYSQLNDWEKFYAHDLLTGGKIIAGVGNVHCGPNARFDYDWDNVDKSVSYADDWLNYPNLKGTTTMVNGSTWGNTQEGHHIWWLKRIPHANGKNAQGIYNNWWKYFNFEDLN